jgi:uncharacterized phage protein (TIGR01671 family)
MREILFRGKGMGGKKWLYGHFFRASGEMPEIAVTEGVHAGKRFMVIPETVGEYTGLKDKNRADIFEGDIVMVRDGESSRIMSVMFINGSFCFTGQRNIYAPLVSSGKLEVVGNIHDTPLKMRDTAR